MTFRFKNSDAVNQAVGTLYQIGISQYKTWVNQDGTTDIKLNLMELTAHQVEMSLLLLPRAEGCMGRVN